MLLKWIFLGILIWYAFRASGNLLKAMAGDQERNKMPPGFDSRTSTKDPFKGHTGQYSEPTPTSRPNPATRASPTHADVEDAKFEDL